MLGKAKPWRRIKNILEEKTNIDEDEREELKYNKGAGIDRSQAEILKVAEEETTTMLHVWSRRDTRRFQH